jgi:type I pantothenate kinase
MRPDPAIDALAGRLVAARPHGRTLVTGLTGAVSAGKSTLAAQLADRLSEQGLSVEVISTDGFLKPNAVLAAEGALDLKGTLRAFVNNQTASGSTQGGSSITQQRVRTMPALEAVSVDPAGSEAISTTLPSTSLFQPW